MQTLLLLHGALGSGEDLSALSNKLKKFEYDLHSITFSGHGGIIFQSEFGIHQFSKELESYIHEKELHKPIVFGYSMGGYVALNLAITNPDIIGKIITLGTKFNWNMTSIEKETKHLDPEILQQKVPDYSRSLENKHGKSWQDLVIKTSALLKKINTESSINAETLKNCKLPVLLGIADKDHLVSIEETLEVYRSLNKASMFMLPNTRHQIETVNCDLLSKIITDFIEQK